jgi:hypothetical protein
VILRKLVINDTKFWYKTSEQILRVLHKYKANELAQLMDLFDTDILDDNGEPITFLKKCEPEFFERITAVLPMHVPSLDGETLLRVMEVLVKRNLGSDRLFVHYLYLRVERRVLLFTEEQYCRLIRCLADKGTG